MADPRNLTIVEAAPPGEADETAPGQEGGGGNGGDRTVRAGDAATSTRLRSRAWRTLREWAPVVTVILAIAALIVSAMILARSALYASEERTAQRLDRISLNIAFVQSDVSAIREDLRSISNRVSYVEGRVDTLFEYWPPSDDIDWPSPGTNRER